MGDASAQIDREIQLLQTSIQERKNIQGQLDSMQRLVQEILDTLGPDAVIANEQFGQGQGTNTHSYQGSQQSSSRDRSGLTSATSHGLGSSGGGTDASGSTLAQIKFNVNQHSSGSGNSCSSGQQSTLGACRLNIVSTDGSSSSRGNSGSPEYSYFSGEIPSASGTSGSTYQAYRYVINPTVGSGYTGGSSQATPVTNYSSGGTDSSGTTVEQYRYFVNSQGQPVSTPYSTQGSYGNETCSHCSQRIYCPSNRNMVTLPLPPYYQPQLQQSIPNYRRTI